MDGLETEREYGPADGFGADKAGFVVGATIKGDCAVVETVGAETFRPGNVRKKLVSLLDFSASFLAFSLFLLCCLHASESRCVVTKL
jgi:hypothetical protein